MSSAPGAVHTTMPTTEAASIANSLPTNIASIGTAAAMTSMILFDFSSISCDSTMVESSRVRKNRMHLADLARSAPRSFDSEPDRRRGVGHGELGRTARCGARGVGDDQLELADGRRIGSERAGQLRVRRGRRSARRGPADRCVASSRFCWAARSRSGAIADQLDQRVVADRVGEPLARRSKPRRSRPAARSRRPPAARPGWRRCAPMPPKTPPTAAETTARAGRT